MLRNLRVPQNGRSDPGLSPLRPGMRHSPLSVPVLALSLYFCTVLPPTVHAQCMIGESPGMSPGCPT